MLLILGGTGEARAIAAQVATLRIAATLSLAGATRVPLSQALPTRTGGFGGEAGFRAYLQEAGITAILDATHPFAHRITGRTAEVARDLGLPYLLLSRPPWTPEDGDLWHHVQDASEVADLVAPGATVFLATGRQTLNDFAGLHHCTLICRQIDPPEGSFPFPNGRYLVGRPPFSVEDETRLFKELQVDLLVVKNAGGTASATKLIAARALGLPVAMIARPPLPEACAVQTVEEALDWIQATCRG